MQANEFCDAKILIVDDEPRDLLLLCDMLGGAGYTAHKGVTDPTLAVALCRSFAPDLIVFNVMAAAPVGASKNVARLKLLVELAALAALGTGKNLPILALIDADQPELRRQALQAGATDLMFKPFDYTEALHRVAQLLRIGHMQTELSDAQEATQSRKSRKDITVPAF